MYWLRSFHTTVGEVRDQYAGPHTRVAFVSATPFEPRAFTAPALWQHGFELPAHPIKVATRLGDNGTVREVRTVHVVGYEGYSKPSPQ